MSKLNRYRVIREHGDFVEGQTRDALAADVAHLVPHNLELIGPVDEPSEKAEAAPDNKAEDAAPANKAETITTPKRKAQASR
jgi:hypothetical protein